MVIGYAWPMSGRIRYLAYGSNMLSARLRERAGSACPLGTALLDGWVLGFGKRGRDGSGKCTIAAAADRHVYGVVYEMTVADKARLDAVEGLGRGYDERVLVLADYGATRCYVAAPAWIDASLRPFDWYRALVVAGARQHRLPAPYVARLEAAATLSDPDRARAGRHLALIEG